MPDLEIRCYACGTANTAIVSSSEWRRCKSCGKQIYFKVTDPGAKARRDAGPGSESDSGAISWSDPLPVRKAPPPKAVTSRAAPRPERKDIDILALWLLIAALLPVLSWPAGGTLSYTFFEPAPVTKVRAPDLADVAAFYPVVVAVLMLVLVRLTQRWTFAIGLLVLGGLWPVVATVLADFRAATAGLLGLETVWDVLVLAGVALAFVSTRTQIRVQPPAAVAWAGAVGGLAVLAWLLIPRDPGGCDGWLGFVCQDASVRVPLGRGVLRNNDFPKDTPIIFYIWWNLILLAWLGFPLMCLLLPFSRASRLWLAGTGFRLLAGIMVAQLLLSVTSPLFAAHLQARQQAGRPEDRFPDLVNGVHWYFPPLILLGVALTGVSELLLTALTPAAPKPPAEVARGASSLETQNSN